MSSCLLGATFGLKPSAEGSSGFNRTWCQNISSAFSTHPDMERLTVPFSQCDTTKKSFSIFPDWCAVGIGDTAIFGFQNGTGNFHKEHWCQLFQNGDRLLPGHQHACVPSEKQKRATSQPHCKSQHCFFGGHHPPSHLMDSPKGVDFVASRHVQ